MSYSVYQQCGMCKKQDTCTDGKILMKAVSDIHGVKNTYDNGVTVSGHQGGGAICHVCTYGFEKK